MLTVGVPLAACALRPTRWREAIALTTAVLVSPWISGVLLAVLLVRAAGSSVDPYEEVVFLQSMAAALRSGASVRGAVQAASVAVPSLGLDGVTRLCNAGRPIEEIADELAEHLVYSGDLAAAALVVGAKTGGRVAAVFSTLAAVQTDEIELQREVRASTATVRASMVVVGGLPIVGLVYSALSGSLSRLLAFGTPGVALVGSGILLLGMGSAAILLLARSATR